MTDNSDVLPLAEEARRLLRLGYSIIPIIPPGVGHAGAGKAPGHYINGGWSGLPKWQRFRDAQPTAQELGLWESMIPGANIGIVCGTDAGDGLHVFALDIDTEDAEEFDAIVRATPQSPMEKRGHKGITRFYRAAPSLKSKSYNVADGRRVVDLLTGYQTRQTVAPPSMHVKGMRYRWICGPIEAARLPEFTQSDLERLEDTLAAMGWNAPAPENEAAKAQAAVRIESGFANDWDAAKAAALSNLWAWVPQLNADTSGALYRLREVPGRGGYECVNPWRESSTGKPKEKRNRNLKIHPQGIRDFGSDETFTPIDLVMKANGCSESEALEWLQKRLNLLTDSPVTVNTSALLESGARRKAAGMSADTAASMPWRREDEFAAFANPEAMELPEELTRNLPGLLGQIADFIVASSRYPQPGFAMGAALSIISAAAGNRYGSPSLTSTQIYVIGLCATSGGKDHPLQFTKTALIEAGLTSRLTTSSKSWQAIVYNLGRDPCQLAVIDEIGAYLGRIASQKASTNESGIKEVMLGLWSTKFDTYIPARGVEREDPPIYSPRYSVFGVSTPKAFYSALQGADTSSGFLNRFLLISTRKKPAVRDPEKEVDDFPSEWLDAIAAIAGDPVANAFASASSKIDKSKIGKDGEGRSMRKIKTRPPIQAKYADDEAKKIWTDLLREVEDMGDNETTKEFYGRVAEMAQRLATLRAIGVDHENPVIDAAGMKWACDLAMWSAERIHEECLAHMAENDHESQRKRIIRAIREAPEGKIGHQELFRIVGEKMASRIIKDHMRDLKEAGIVFEQQIGTRKIYFLEPPKSVRRKSGGKKK